jgi:hypothetical protein
VAYAALPLVLHVLDVKLSNSSSQAAMKQRRLDIYTEAMKALQAQYDGTDQVSNIIGTMVDNIKLDNTSNATDAGNSPASNIAAAASPASVLRNLWGPNPVKDWGDVLVRQPSCYLRLALTIDLSLAEGKFPDDADFPVCLQSQNPDGPAFPRYLILLNDAGPPQQPSPALIQGPHFRDYHSPGSELSGLHQSTSINTVLGGAPYGLYTLDQRFLNQTFDMQDMGGLGGMEIPMEMSGFENVMPEDAQQVGFHSWPDPTFMNNT